MPMILAEDVRFRYREDGPWTIDGVSMSVEAGRSVGIVGESGSGKSTFIRILSGLLVPASGRITIDGTDLARWRTDRPRELRRLGQMVFQSPANSFDPHMRLGRAISEPIRALDKQVPTAADLEGMVTRVGLGTEMLQRYPHQLSGGQLQRMSLARALSVGPKVLYADEPTSALDVSVQAEVLALLKRLRAELGLTLVLVTHDLAVVSQMCDEVVVLRNGQVVERGETRQILRSPSDDYTRALVEAARAVSLRRHRTAPLAADPGPTDAQVAMHE